METKPRRRWRTLATHALSISGDHSDVTAAAQNPDVLFQGEAENAYYDSCPARVRRVMERFAVVTERRYGLFDYVGSADADRVI